jgi:quercetin dioxygenase-like cupin family protein
MKLINYKDVPGTEYPSDLAKGAVGRVVIGQADGDPSFCLRVFELSPEGHSALHSHPYEHQVFVHSGQGEVWNGSEWQDIAAGSVIFIPGGTEHQLRNKGDNLLVFACAIPKGAPEL